MEKIKTFLYKLIGIDNHNYILQHKEMYELEKEYNLFFQSIETENVELLNELFEKKLVEYDKFQLPPYPYRWKNYKLTALNFLFDSVGGGYVTKKHVDILCILVKHGANLQEKSYEIGNSTIYPNHFIWLCDRKMRRWVSVSKKAIHIIDIFLKAGVNINYYEEYNEFNSILFNVVEGYTINKERKKSHTTSKSFVKSKTNSTVYAMIIRKLIVYGHNLNEPKLNELLEKQKEKNKKKMIYIFFKKELPNLFLFYCFEKKNIFITL